MQKDACLTDAVLHRYHAGELEDAAGRTAQLHLAACSSCARRSASIISRHDDLLHQVRGIRNLLAGPLVAVAHEHTSTREIPLGVQATGVRSPGIGDCIGPYCLKQVLGEGGFGVVYLASQEKPIRRDVALKLIKAGMESRQIIARFEAERQALAVIDHPCVAKVLDAGATQDGRPFFVMEYVRGRSITEFCEQYHLPLRRRIELFLHVCDAVQHAHQKGIIHRDIKPSNVLVSRQDDQPLVKVIDFGIAKAIEQPLTDATLHTQEGHFVGTPEYMSPEQATGGAVVDTRTDIYSLGVLLYELLTGALPFDPKQLRALGYGEMLRIIREDDPQKPSTRIASLHSGTASRTAGRTATDKITPAQIAGDLDWITLKALEKDPARRYPSASEFAADIRRHLGHEIVLASPPSRAYRIQKLVRRHRTAVIAGAVTFVVLIAGIIGTSYMAVIASRQKDEALLAREEADNARVVESAQRKNVERREADTRQVAEFQSQMLEQMTPYHVGKALMNDLEAKFEEAILKQGLSEAEGAQRLEHLRNDFRQIDFTTAAADLIDHTMLSPAIKTIDDQFAKQPLVAADLRETLATIYEKLGKPDVALTLQQRALDLRRGLLDANDRRIISALNNVSILLSSQQKMEEAEAHIRDALDRSKSAYGIDDPKTIRALANLGSVLEVRGKLQEAKTCLAEALARRRRVLGDDHVDTLVSMGNMASILHGLGELDEAESTYRDVLARRRRLLGEDNHDTLKSINNFGYFLKRRGKLSEAEPYYREGLALMRRVLGENHPDTLSAMNNLGALLGDQGKLAEAEAYYLEALNKRRKYLPKDHPHTLVSINNMGFFLFKQGKRPEAEAYFREALAKLRRIRETDHSDTLTAIENVAVILKIQEKWADAEPFFREALAIRGRIQERGPSDTSATTMNLAAVLIPQGKFAEAETLLLPAIEKADAASPQVREAFFQSLIKLYEAWHAVKPEGGYDARAASWAARRAASSQPVAAPTDTK